MTASKQPESAALNLKVIALTLSFFLFLGTASGSRPSSFSLWLSSHLLSPLSKKVSLSFSYGVFPLKASVFFPLPSFPGFHSVCHGCVLFSITLSLSLKQQLHCLPLLWKALYIWVRIGTELKGFILWV